MISLNIEKTFGFISKEKVFAYEAEVKAAQEMLEKGTGKGNDFLGWLHLPCLLYTSDAADDLLCVDLGGRRIIKNKNTKKRCVEAVP